MKSQPHHRSYYPALDGLRGTGCLLIVVYHLFPFLQKYLVFGWAAMDIFFVLSGFLITDILVRTFGKEGFLKNFYARRLLRVFPLYYTALIVFLLIIPQFGPLPIKVDYFVSNQWWFWTFLQNWLLIFKPFPSQAYLNHLWSMAVEEQFYLLWPLVFAAVKKPKPLLVLLSVLLVGFISLRFYLWINRVEGLAYFNLYSYTRIDGICVGCMVALIHHISPGFLARHMALIVLAFAGFNFLFYLFNLKNNDSFPYLGLVGFSTFSMIFGMLVSEMVTNPGSFFNKLLDIRPLKFLGQISYGTYILHWPVYLLIYPYLLGWIGGEAPRFGHYCAASAATMVLSYLLGYLSYRYFEMPFLRLKKYFA